MADHTERMDRSEEGAREPVVEDRSLGDTLRLGGGVALVLALALFFIQNFDDARISFLWFDRSIPLVFALLLSAAVGALATWLFSTLRGRAARRQRDIEVRAMAAKKR